MRTVLCRTATAIAVGAAVALAAGCGASDSTSDPGGGVIAVVASTDVYGDLAEQIGGDAVQVTSIIDDPDQDPHSFEASTATQLAISRASVIIENGGGYDTFVDTMRSAHNRSATVLNAVTLTGHRPTAHGELNEHVWYDLAGMKKVVDAMSRTFATEAPARAAAITSRAGALNARIDALVRSESAVAAAHRGAGVAITEPVPLYLLQAAGLQNKTPAAFSEAIEEGTDVSARVLNETVSLFTRHRVRLLAYNAQTTGPQTTAVLDAARAAGIPVVAVTETLPRNTHYVDWMRENVDAVRTALS